MYRRLISLLLALSATAALAQTAPDYGEEVAVSYVMIPFTVLGSKGAPIIDLRQNEVSLLVDGQPVSTDMFEKSMNAPVSWTILVDGSGSMGLAGKIASAQAAIEALVARRKPGDDYALYVFASGHANEAVPFTDDPNRILAALAKVKPWGKTAFFDALAQMPERSSLGKNPTRAIVLLSDGIDNFSKLTKVEIEKRLEGVAIPIYALGLREPGERQLPVTEELTDIALLEELSTITGGKLFLGNRPEQLASAMDAIENNLRAQYLLGFSPTGKGTVKYRRISLQLAGRVRSVRVRAGYRGTEPPALSATTRKTKPNERKKG
jgi:VWFA-related protein